MSYFCDKQCSMAKLIENYDKTRPNGDRIIGEITPEVAKVRFLELYMNTGHVQKTCQILGLVPRTVYHWLKGDPDFKEEFELVRGFATVLLEDEATRRGVYGVDEPVFQGGKLVGYVRKYSDYLLGMLLKANAPDKYRENWKGTLTDANGNPLGGNKITINHIHTDAKKLATTEEEIEIEVQREGGAPDASKTEDISYELLPPLKKPTISDDQDSLEHAE